MFLLVALGLAMIYSVTAATAIRPTIYLESQATKILLGAVFFVLALRFDYHRYARLAPWLFAGGLVLLVAVLLFGHEAKGAQRWLTVAGQTFQPVDFARLGLIAYLAFLLSKPKAKLERFGTGLMPCLVALGLAVAPLLLQPNLSSALALTMVAVLMAIAGRIPWKHLGMTALAAAVLAPAVAKLLGREYQFGRLVAWWKYVTTGEGTLGSNYQLHQSILAIGSGGVMGQGLGESRQKWLFLPDAHTDFIFAIVGEELGLLGSVLVILLLLVVLWRAYEAARRAPDRFGMLLAVGIGGSFAVYSGVNLAVVTGLFPTTGLPLPLVSYGGTAVIAMLFSLGLLGNILAQSARAPRAPMEIETNVG